MTGVQTCALPIFKDVALPETMKRSMSRQAEAERERRSRVIIADGELQASNKLAQASEAMAHTPSALQLRLLQTIVEVASERNSTLVLPFPVELLRFLENNTPTAPPTTEAGTQSTTEAGVTPTTDTPAEAVDRSESDTTPSAPADLDAIVQAMSESLKLTGLMPEQERVTSDMPEQERTTSDAAARSDVADQEQHFGHA